MEIGLIMALVVVVTCGAIATRDDIRRLKVQAKEEAPKVAKVMNVEPKPLAVPVGEAVKHKQKKRKKRAKLKAGA